MKADLKILIYIFNKINYCLLEVVDRVSETQLQVGGNSNLTMLWLTRQCLYRVEESTFVFRGGGVKNNIHAWSKD